MNPRALRRVREALAKRVHARTIQLRDITAELHINAPRGGTNINEYGQPRSAPGEQPAIEHGTLLNAILNEWSVEGLTGEVVVNRVGLEFGEGLVEPRPMGRMAVEQLRVEVESGS